MSGRVSPACFALPATPGRRKDLGDVQELIRLLRLPAEFAEKPHSSVRSTYHELWTEVQGARPA